MAKTRSPSNYRALLIGDEKFNNIDFTLDSQEKKSTLKFNAGCDLTGYSPYLHGGALASIFDEALVGTALSVQKHPVTAILEMQFKKPIRCGRNYQIKSVVKTQVGRKVWVEGCIRNDDGDIMCCSKGLFIEAKSVGILEYLKIKVDRLLTSSSNK